MDAAGAKQKDQAAVITSMIIGQVILLGICNFFYALNRVGFPAGLSSVSRTYHFSVLQTTTLGTVFLLGQALADIPVGYLVDRVSRKVLLFWGVMGIGATTALFTFLTFNYSTALIWRVLFGVTEGVTNITLIATLGAMLPKRRGTLVSFNGASNALGSFVGPIGLALMIRSMGQWQMPLQIFSVATAIWSIIILFVLRVSDKDFPAMAEHKKRMPVGEGLGKAMARLFKNLRFCSGLVIFVFNAVALWGFAGVGAYILAHYKGLSTVFAATVLGTSYGIGGFGAPFVGYLSDKVGRWKPILVIALLNVASLAIMFCTPIVTHWVLIVTGLVFGCGQSSIYYMGYSVVQDRVDLDQVGLATGTTGAIGYLLGAFSGALIGFITQSAGYVTAVYIVLIVPELIVALGAIFVVAPDERAKKAAIAASYAG